MQPTFDLLVVDDDIGQARLLEILIKELELPHRCHYASDGGAALDLLHGRHPCETALRPHLILLDLNMPRMNGWEVLRAIKSDPELRTIPVIILSQSLNPKDVEACYGERANAYIGKSSDLEGNLRLLRELDRFWGHTARLPDPPARELDN